MTSSSTAPTGELTEGEKASRDVLELISEHYRMVVRASGTEAKLKYYFDFREAPAGEASAATRSEAVRSAATGLPSWSRSCGPTALLFTPIWRGGRVTSCRPGH